METKMPQMMMVLGVGSLIIKTKSYFNLKPNGKHPKMI